MHRLLLAMLCVSFVPACAYVAGLPDDMRLVTDAGDGGDGGGDASQGDGEGGDVFRPDGPDASSDAPNDHDGDAGDGSRDGNSG